MLISAARLFQANVVNSGQAETSGQQASVHLQDLRRKLPHHQRPNAASTKWPESKLTQWPLNNMPEIPAIEQSQNS